MTRETTSRLSGDPTIEITNADKRYGKAYAVRNVSLRVEPGESIALLGHNGAGKTTMMKLMLGLITPSAGRIRILGEDPALAHAAPSRMKLGYLPENISFYPAMTGRETLTYFARLKRDGGRDIAGLLDQVGLSDAADRRVATYSKGMRQRLGLAQTLIGEPQILLLDEPTTGLDPFLRRQFYDILSELTERGASVVLSSHALTELEARTDRVAIMARGDLVACGTLEDLRREAGLPMRIRVAAKGKSLDSIASRFAGETRVARVNNHAVDIIFEAEQKMAVLNRVACGEDPVEDVEFAPPTLDDIYAFFQHRSIPS